MFVIFDKKSLIFFSQSSHFLTTILISFFELIGIQSCSKYHNLLFHILNFFPYIIVILIPTTFLDDGLTNTTDINSSPFKF
ncbi:hypothetical protein GLOIN_2v1667374 [Rhizophagus irregularis DAOM 181602=DAOM 197198]|uniref:Uncharacterized protein n=1 Tax=Rhizophagus irregularis (strain DAOM 181602 / DAOM 197198 / MUCL 43194) TaxID=747089 RepID=A0A2P4PIZ3_RHIID|nr:hypothetical protein GLOIN_2v1667374 [Rhizophagus irregularis DAOM 181602=DAOM 197198]POG65353.1 hypothetical protein GLOIN_2v1667374 [Rhizophagus irregularis DAOM 181602=DAOM 197198]GET58068.1 hypothetical protein GLOIN_2v1667374 [Rhizophagus irregularis DAOM 181602=DAOM 197198]|eukprot:XP_025172219.1 hypothetical protein GLOIN_2v1667374 [Rhizophagus irregularis DAOM 181602=DAOM 197198]